MQIRPVTAADRAGWLRMRCALWPGHEATLAEEIDRFFSGSLPEPQAVLVAEEAGTLVGLAELSIRPHAEGCHSQRVAFLEAWFVEVRARRHGLGRSLVVAAGAWAHSQGCSELASDCELDNDVSRAAHIASGFEEVAVIRCFRKAL